jgi:uncharacterized protein YbjT (DUF2867 family)
VILVAGATGDLGKRVVRRLRERDEQVRCLVRPTSDASALEALGAGIARGDLLDPVSLRSACEGVATVVCTATAISRLLTGAGGPSLREVDDAGVASLIGSAEQEGVERFVYLSYAGVDAGLGFPLERAKAANEERLRRSSMRAVIVRPDGFQEVQLAPIAQFDVAQGKIGILGKGDMRRRFVSTEDVAALVVAVALEPDPPALIEFGGPEALSRNEAVELVERVSGRKMKRRRLPRPVVRLVMRLAARRKPALASVFGVGLLMDLHESGWDETPLRDRGIDARSVAEYLREQAG